MKKVLSFLAIAFCCTAHAQIITTIAGNDTDGYSGDGGQATTAKLSYVDAVAVDNNGNVYISERNNVIRKVNILGIISTFAGNDTMGFSGDGGPATAAKLSQPKCIAFDKYGNVYFIDEGNSRVRKVDALGIITTIAGDGSATASGDLGPATAAGLGAGQGICMDAVGNIYIAAGNRIRKVDAYAIITTFAGNGLGGYSGDGGAATAAELGSSEQIEIDVYGNMYIASSITIRKINAAGIINTVAGNVILGRGYSGDNAPATAAQLNNAYGVFPDECGNIYIADYTNNRIRKVDEHGIITTIAGTGYGSTSSSGGFSGDGGQATAAELYHPETIYLDGNSNIYIADEFNFCVRYIKQENCMGALTSFPFGNSSGQAVTVYPNPNNGTFTVSFSSPVSEQVSVSVTNMMGMKVKTFTTLSNKEQELQLNVPAGVYFLSVSSAGGRYVQKVVVE